jgi:hypothetical protein
MEKFRVTGYGPVITGSTPGRNHHHHHQPGSGFGLPLLVFVMVRCVRCGVISPTINLVLVILIRPPETSVSKASRHLVAKQMKHE